jgi:subtilisin
MRRRWLVGAAVVAVFCSVFCASALGSIGQADPGHYIVTLKPSAGDPGAVAADEAKKGRGAAYLLFRHALWGYAAVVRGDRLAALEADPRVESVTVDRVVQAAGVASAAARPCEICGIKQITTRAIRRVGAQLSSTQSGDGTGSVPVNVAVLDTGIQPDQPDLNVIGGINCAGHGSRLPLYADHEGHGTMVGGLIGALDNTIGIVGVAPGARLWSVRVLNRKGGRDSGIICGIDWVTATRTDGDPSNDIAVANMSLGGSFGNTAAEQDGNCGYTNKDLVHQAICRSTAAGVTYVAGAGNDEVDFGKAGFSPANYPEVLTAAGMVDSDGAPGAAGPPDPCLGQPDDIAAYFSNYATRPTDEAHTVAGPAVCVSSTYLKSRVATDSGTSFAAPIVTGTVALCIYSGPCAGLTPAQIVAKIVSDAASYNSLNPGYGFAGDPLRPEGGKYYGNLISASIY